MRGTGTISPSEPLRVNCGRARRTWSVLNSVLRQGQVHKLELEQGELRANNVAKLGSVSEKRKPLLCLLCCSAALRLEIGRLFRRWVLLVSWFWRSAGREGGPMRDGHQFGRKRGAKPNFNLTLARHAPSHVCTDNQPRGARTHVRLCSIVHTSTGACLPSS
jgi:hypothetical protein